MSLNLEEFVSDSQAPTFTTETLLDSKIPLAQNSAKNGESIEETTRKIFEKIIQAKKAPTSAQKQAKKKKALLAKRAQEEKERARLAKEKALKEQLAKEKQLEEAENRKKALLASEKKKQEMLATQQALQEQERLAKEKEKQTTEEQATKALMAEKLAKMHQEKRRREKAKLAQKEADKKRKEKVRKQKLVAQKRAKQKLTKEKLLKKRALEKKLAKKRAAKRSTKGKTSKQGRSKYANSAMGRSTQQMIHEFYGDEFSHFTGTQQKFIEKNLGNIYVITQRVLSHKGYPFKAKQRHQQGVQLVTFYLHPNGRISKLKFLQRSKYKVLNDNTLKIIRFAHQKYPRPKTTTKITFFVVYTLQ